MHEFASSADNENNHNPMDSFKLIAARGDILDDIQNGNQNLANSIEKRINEQKRFFGIEISPANSGDLDYNQFPVQPLFTSIAWLFDTNVNYHPLSTAPAIRLGKSAQHCSPVLMHLTCYKLTDAKLREFLDLEFKNILALKGDLSLPNDSQPWTYAIDLVRAIRQSSADATIGVAGYPEMHEQASSHSDDLQRLKAKVDAGANFIITNTCFSFEHLAQFIRSCRAAGIAVPIIAGIYVPSSYQELDKMCRICKVVVPRDQLAMYERFKADSERFITYAIANAVNLLTQIFTFEEHRIYGVHFFTLNKYEHLAGVIRQCDFANK